MSRKRRYIKKKSDSFFKRISSTWASLVAGIAICSAGFSAGLYIASSLAKIEQFEKEYQHQNELILLKKKHEEEIYSLHKEIYELQKTILQNGNKEK